MTNNHEDLARDLFQNRIQKGLIGPGSDVFVNEDEIDEEIISDNPLQRYYSAILFPERTRPNSQDEADVNQLKNETESDDSVLDRPKDCISGELGDNNKTQKEPSEDNELRISQNSFFPTNMGLTFCIPDHIKEIDVVFSFGLYHQIEKNLRIACPESVYNEFINNSAFPFKELIRYENGHLILDRKLKGRNKQPRTEEFSHLDGFKKSETYKDSTIKYIFHFFEKLIGRTWVREFKNFSLSIPIKNTDIPVTLFEKNIIKTKINNVRAAYTLKTYKISQNPKNIYVKIQLLNNSDVHQADRFSNANEQLNAKSIFQAKIKAISKEIQPYKSYSELNPLDKEGEIYNYLFKDVLSFGIGHNCSVSWDTSVNNPKCIETTFLPQYDVKDTKNSFSEEDFIGNQEAFNKLNSCLDLYNLSHFTKDNKLQIINKLNDFVGLYGEWINQQKQKVKTKGIIENAILENLETNYSRLIQNIKLLNNEDIFTSFKLANTAMLIQIIISNDKDFAKREKDLTEIDEKINYKNIEFFRDYDFSRLSFNRPKYRPFQLAFLLLKLNIENTDLDLKTGKEIVDLIWFPTGGGKTEAYLAVAAFTIIFRRLSNKSGYEGTSVIMRYTLRLLTAQQFERASRLIVALEFLRNIFPNELKDEPITIGMWVGMSSTPNSLKEAKAKVEEINEECNKLKGNPEQKNVFQISSCPWCGSKLINKNKHGLLDYGFKIHGSGNNLEFKINCLNERCFFHKELPLQVVDEMLYDKPPTLLFGTVDKFAMLAWQPKGHNFFNSLDETKLPPDLIIQDELHLLSGPLGSITGLYESVIEILCTKNGRRPKIISSTATTRNTEEQIKALYGNNRMVNIFPPSGLSSGDSFFAKTFNSESKRRYIGFIPTGKSAIDTQLQIFANLFVARYEVYKSIVQNGVNDFYIFDKYWTIVSYYNSLKDVGKIHNKVGDEISNFTSTLQVRLFGEDYKAAFNYLYLSNRDKELTGRISGHEIKQTLKELEENKFTSDSIVKSDNKDWTVRDVIDLVLATNMISVGIDIERFNIMLINGQPRNIAEYIQASSRVGRKFKGLVIDLLDANRARDKSHFEHFIPFHQAFYKSIEPISITPFTNNTLEKMLASIMITFVRHKIPGMAAKNAAQYFKPGMVDELKSEIRSRYSEHPKTFEIFERKLDELSSDWIERIEKYNLKYYESINTEYKTEIGLLVKPSEKTLDIDNKWSVMQSMREIDTNSFIKIELPKIN